jgi:hypothetical protein
MSASVYGFQARRIQVGYSRLGYCLLLISGKPEISAAPRNDENQASAAGANSSSPRFFNSASTVGSRPRKAL